MSTRLFGTTRRILAILGLLAGLFTLLAGSLTWWRFQSSLARIDGRARLPGLAAPASITRDDLGVPRIEAGSELDAYRALGYCHAQDRFFQMDLLRRRAAGELSALVGDKTLIMDALVSLHEFRRHATESWELLPADQKALAQAYTEGVNAGLASLQNPPWEYALLRQKPRPWEPVDSLLAGYTMTLELQDGGSWERSLGLLRDTLGDKMVDFLSPLVGPHDAAMDGSLAPLPPIPGPEVLNLRKKKTSNPEDPDIQVLSKLEPAWRGSWISGAGSNALCLDGSHSQDGSALLASDMHLALGVPNIWYRAEMHWPQADKKADTPCFVGITLPGVPLPVAGSNGHVAWGFTASYADTCDLVPIENIGPDEEYYHTRDGLKYLEKWTRTIQIRGSEPRSFQGLRSVWGPVIGRNERGQQLALQWVAHKPGAIDLHFARITHLRSAGEAARLGSASGLPALNMLSADEAGNIAWTIAGRLPDRYGHDGRLPVTHAFAERGWKGFLDADKAPLIMSPKDGYLTSANERLVSGPALALVGDGGYEAPDRARQLRADTDTLARRGGAKVEDLLAIQLDDRALSLEPWKDRLLAVLGRPEAVKIPGADLAQAELKAWNGRASADSAAYPVLRNFREQVRARVLLPLVERCTSRWESFEWWRLNSGPAVEVLLQERPMHLLALEYADWDSLLLAAARDAIENRPRSWGDLNTAAIRHPLLQGLPRWLTAWADMPAAPLDGDSHLPRVCTPSFGASERLVVSPGRENEGILHMPGGQSAHPRSPFFRAGFAEWVRGIPLPLRPRNASHRLLLEPSQP